MHSPSPTRSAARPVALRPAFQLVTIALVLAWVALTLSELAAAPGTLAATWLDRLSTGLAVPFAIELGLRLRAASQPAAFLLEYWIDVVALLSVPLSLLLPPSPVLLLFRLLRLYRLIALVRRVPLFTGFVHHRGPRRALALLGIVALCVVVSTAALLAFESGKNPGLASLDQAFWFSLFSIFATQPTPDVPMTLGGKLVSLFLIFVGLSTFAVLTGTVSAVVLSRLKLETKIVDLNEIKDHTIICGWSRKAEIIAREFIDGSKEDAPPLVVIATHDAERNFADPRLIGRVQFIDDDFTRIGALERAGIARASTCVILSDTSGGRSEPDADARTILTALTIQSLHPHVYRCAELNRSEYSAHLKSGCINECVVGGEHSAFLLAQAALNHGAMSVLNELMTHRSNHKFCRIPVPRGLIGKSFVEALSHMKQEQNVLVVALATGGGAPTLNPGECRLAAGDELMIIADADYET